MRDDETESKPAERPAVVLVAHGASGSEGAGTSLRTLAARLRLRPDLGPIEPAFIHGAPNLATVLDRLTAQAELCVVPMFAGEGHHTRRIVAAVIEQARVRQPGRSIRQTEALGIHPAYTRSLGRRLIALADAAGIASNEAAVVAIGHGSRRAPAAIDDAARRLASWLRPAFACAEALYLDGEPQAAAWSARIRGPAVIVAPIFFSDAQHACVDVPRLFGLPGTAPAGSDRIDGPWIRAGRRLWLASLPPLSDCVAELVAGLALEGRNGRAPRRAPALLTAGAAP